MSNNIEAPNVSRKFILLSVISGILLVAAFVIVILLNIINTEPDSEPTQTSNVSEQLDSALIPETTDYSFEYVDGENTAVIGFTVEQTETDLVAEYRIQNQTKETVAEGVVTDEKQISVTVPVTSGSNEFSLKMRVSDANLYSAWMPAKTWEVENTVPIETETDEGAPNDAFYATAWAKGEGGQENLETSLNSAWGATHVTGEDLCMEQNRVIIAPGETIGPIPSMAPNGFAIKYSVWPVSETDFSVQYYWCELPIE